MALRIVTPEGGFCSSCWASVGNAELCLGCGQPIMEEAPGVTCSRCGRVVQAGRPSCPICGFDFLAKGPPGSGDLNAPAPAAPKGALSPPVPPPSRAPDEFAESRRQGPSEAERPEGEPTALPEESEANLLSELESRWKMSEPFEQVVAARRHRLEQMDRLIAAARRRIRELEGSEMPTEAREREELKRQLGQVVAERDEILKIEYGITEMERIYRNIITLQQKELRSKEESLKARLEGFRREIEVRDAERREFADQARELSDREKSLQARLSEVAARERQLSVSPRPAKPGDSEIVSKEEWLEAHREIQDSLVKLRGTEGEAAMLPTASAVRDLRMRMNELEETLEKTGEEKTKLERQLADVRAAEGETREVLKVLDDLLGQLSEKTIREFARSEAFRRYERLMERLGL